MRYTTSCVMISCVIMAAPLQAQEGGVAVVAQLYRDFAWEVVVAEPMWHGHYLLEQPRAVLERYLDSSLTTLLLADRRCVSEGEGICNLDFDPIWNSQDPGATDLAVTATSDPTRVSVRFRQAPQGNRVALLYLVVRTQAGWRIRDIRYPNGTSLVQILSRPIGR